jgi:hypothetical protein
MDNKYIWIGEAWKGILGKGKTCESWGANLVTFRLKNDRFENLDSLVCATFCFATPVHGRSPVENTGRNSRQKSPPKIPGCVFSTAFAVGFLQDLVKEKQDLLTWPLHHRQFSPFPKPKSNSLGSVAMMMPCHCESQVTSAAVMSS